MIYNRFVNQSFFNLIVNVPKGLIHLPTSVVSSKYVRPVTLSNNCGEGLDEETTLTVGMGGRNKRPILRYALLEIRSKDTCQQLLETEVGLDATSIICAYSPSQFIFNGDSGTNTIVQRILSLVFIVLFCFHSLFCRWSIDTTARWSTCWCD